MQRNIYQPASYTEVWLLSYPIILSMISQTVMWTVDTIMVGKLGSTELGAVGLGGIIVWTIMSFFVGVATSVTTFVAQDYGAGRKFDCGANVWQGIYMALAAGVLIMICRELMDDLLRWIRPSKDVQSLADDYMRARMLGGFFVVYHFTVGNFFRGIGDTKTPMWILAGANLANIILDYLMIFGHAGFPKLGVMGAGYATAISNVLASAFFAWRLHFGKTSVSLGSRARYRLDLSRLRRMLRVGIPVGIHYIADMSSFTVFSAYISRMGNAPLAANHIVIQVLSFSFMPCQAFGLAANTLVGQYLGAGRPDRAELGAIRAVRMGLYFAMTLAVSFVAFRNLILSIFTRDPDVIAVGGTLILLAALFQLFDALQMVASGALRGSGDTRWPMFMSSSLAYLFFLPLAYLFGTVLDRGVVGAWEAATIYIVALGSIMYLRFKKGAWKDIEI